MIDWQLDAQDLDRVALQIVQTEAQAQKALTSTLRKMANWLRARSVKGMSAELAIQQKIIRRRLKATRLKKSARGSEIGVWFGLNPVALVYLQAKQDKRKGGGVRAAGGRFVKGAFIARMPGEHRGVYSRRGKARLPIDQEAAEIESKTHDFIEHQTIDSAAFEAQFWKTFEHELKWQAGK